MMAVETRDDAWVFPFGADDAAIEGQLLAAVDVSGAGEGRLWDGRIFW